MTDDESRSWFQTFLISSVAAHGSVFGSVTFLLMAIAICVYRRRYVHETGMK